MTEAADAHGASWPTAHRAFVSHAEALLAEPERHRCWVIDETRRGKPRWERCAETGCWVRVDAWDNGFGDLAGNQGPLGQVQGRTAAAVIDRLAQRDPELRDTIEFVAIDLAAGYAAAIRTALPGRARR